MDMQFYWSIPFIPHLSPQTVAILSYFFAIVLGMCARAIYDKLERHKKYKLGEHLGRPLLISPIVLLAVIGMFAIKGDPLELNITSFLIAFQTGFAWKQALEKQLQRNT